MGYRKNYISYIKNVENQDLIVRIEDRLSGNLNPYNISVETEQDPTDIIVRFYFNMPATATGITIGYSADGGATWTDIPGYTGSPAIMTIPITPGVGYKYRLIVNYADPADDEIFLTDELEGELIELEPATDPVILEVNNNEQRKDKSIATTKCLFSFLSSADNNLSTFLRGEYSDKRYFLTVCINNDFDYYVFKGFVSMADNQEPFLPHSNRCTLTATCGLSALSNVPLKTFLDANPTGLQRYMDFIAWCLRFTGLEEFIYVVMNLRHGTGTTTVDYGNFSNASSTIFFPLTRYKQFYAGQRLLCTSTGANNGSTFTVVTNNDGFNIQVTPAPVHEGGIVNFTLADVDSTGHFFDKLFVDAKTFEAEIGESEDCYTVLDKLLSKIAIIGQRHGQWWIKGIDEFAPQDDVVNVFSYNGEYLEELEAAAYDKEIGPDKPMGWMNETGLVTFTAPNKFCKLVYKYETPKEIPCNIDFQRGDLVETVSEEDKHYDIECWDKLFSNTLTDDPATADIYIRRLFYNGYEKERYVVIEGNADFNFIMSEPIEMHAKDKFELGVDRRLSSDVSGSGFYRDRHIQVRLYGADGTFWTHAGRTSASNERKWVQCTSTFRTNQQYFAIEGDAADDLRESASLYDGESAELPVDGTIKILAYRSGLYGTTRDTYLNISFSYLKFINGVYEKYTGQQHHVSQPAFNNESIDEQVYISDSPKKILKGALHIYNGSKYILATRFWNAALNPTGAPNTDVSRPFGYHQALALWNQYRLINRIFTGDVDGIESDSLDVRGRPDIPTIFHRYRITEVDEHSSNRIFRCVGYQMNLQLCQWTPTLIECYDELRGKTYTDPYELKYITR